MSLQNNISLIKRAAGVTANKGGKIVVGDAALKHQQRRGKIMYRILFFIFSLFLLFSSANNNMSIQKNRNTNFNFFKDTVQDCTDTADMNKIYFYGFLNKGINETNILTESTKYKIQDVLFHYYSMKDFNTDSFYKRELVEPDKKISCKQYKLYKSCMESLSFGDVVPEEVLESDWRYPINQIKSLSKVYDLYKNETYGDGIMTELPYFHMYLYMYFATPSERKEIENELIVLKRKLKISNKDKWLKP